MGRYIKNKSKYILAKFHQNIAQGTLYERDWVTIGNVHRLEPGKRPFYSDGNFVFTENILPVYNKKRKNGKWVGNYTYDDVKNATDVINQIKVNTDSENLTDYAYWGSMVELFRGSLEHIIETFPGRLRSTKNKFYIHRHQPNENDGVEYWTEAPGYILGNPFNLNMHNLFDDIPEDKLIRYLALTWKSYVLEDHSDNSFFPITSYEIYDEPIQYDCEERYFKLCWIRIYCGNYTLIVDTYLADGQIIYCYRENSQSTEFLIEYYSGIDTSGMDEDYGESNSSDSAGKFIANSRDYVTPVEFSLHPNAEVIEAYFRGLEDFEWKLLNRRTNPLYTNYFLLPIQLNNGSWRLVRRKYTWPSEGYCIDIESTDYNDFVSGMLSLCQVYDELWCDSIWRCMVHEAVKNFDWSYRREYEDNDSEENIEGGERMRDVMRLLGIIYDKTKRLVDGIKMTNCITYDGYNNCPNAQISDKNILLGWDIVSTQHQFYWYEQLQNMPIGEDIVQMAGVPIEIDDESPEYISVGCQGSEGSRYFKKSTLYIPDASLDNTFYENSSIVHKSDNPWIPTNSYNRLYVEIGYNEIPDGYDFSCCTYNDFPYMLFSSYSVAQDCISSTSDDDIYPYVKVESNSGVKYYKLLQGSEIASNNERYVNDTWFPTRYTDTVTFDTTDILFNRALNLSSNRILKSKGCKESIEMIFALFGFGLYDSASNPYGDFTLEERFYESLAKRLDEVFYFYEMIAEEDAPSGLPEETELPVDPTYDSPQYVKIMTDYGDGTLYPEYYKLNGENTVYGAIKLLYAHRLTERTYDDYYSGVPIKETYHGNTHIVVPFFDKSKLYEGDLYFESNGGWMKEGETDDYTWKYSETIPYLHILQRISDLYNINTNGVNNGDIYFVADVSDYYEYNAYTPYYLSNFFKLKDKYNPSMFSSWVNIPMKGSIIFGNTYDYYVLVSNSGVYSYEGPEYTEPVGVLWDDSNTLDAVPSNPSANSPQYVRVLHVFDGVTYEDYLHAKHLDEIIPSILFNNPHCGFDRYDMGAEYKKYMEYPYTYSAENYLYDDDYYRNMASQFHFGSTERYEGKINVTASTRIYDDNGSEIRTNQNEPLTSVTNDKWFKITLVDCENGEPLDAAAPMNRLHLEYMRNVVMKYVAQVIPSTTLLVLDNFVPTQPGGNDYATITIDIVDEDYGYAYGEGTYLKSTMITLKAVASEGYHFAYWSYPGNRSHTLISYTPELSVMVCTDKTYTAVFKENCEITIGCKEVSQHDPT